MRRFILLALLVLAPLAPFGAFAQVPARALELLPSLVDAQRLHWPEAPLPWFLAAQVEKESCITLRHSRCWSTRAELKTDREYGFGLGQITIAYRADGSVRFNKWAELRTQFPPLRAWSWDQRFDPAYQLTALVLMDKGLCKLYADAATVEDGLGFCLSAYNGGEGGVRQDRLLCSNTPGCDRTRWFDHVEHHSMKSRVPWKGYGKSAFQINREYPREIRTRRSKYEQFFVVGRNES
jgi:hypothetical protein